MNTIETNLNPQYVFINLDIYCLFGDTKYLTSSSNVQFLKPVVVLFVGSTTVTSETVPRGTDILEVVADVCVVVHSTSVSEVCTRGHSI